MSNFFVLIFLISMYTPKEITVKGTIGTCISYNLGTAIINYEIKNMTTKDYILNVYDLQFSWQIKNSLGEVVQPDWLIERVIKVDTSKHLINHKYILVKACSVSTVAVETNLFSSHKLNKGESYTVISGYSSNERTKIKNVPVYNKSIEVEPIKFSICKD